MSETSKFFSIAPRNKDAHSFEYHPERISACLRSEMVSFVQFPEDDNFEDSDDEDAWDDNGQSRVSTPKLTKRALDYDDFVVPLAPRVAKRFRQLDLNSSIDCFTGSLCSSCADESRISWRSSQVQNSQVQQSQTGSVALGHISNPSISDNTFTLPSRPFNPESISMLHAFSDFARFVRDVDEENRLFLLESDLYEFMNSQRSLSGIDLSITVTNEIDLSINKSLKPHEQTLQRVINSIVIEVQKSPKLSYKRDCYEMQTEVALTRIRSVFAIAIQNTTMAKTPKRKTRRAKTEPSFQVRSTNWNNLVYKDGMLVIADENVKYSAVKQRKYLVAYCLRKIYCMLTMNTKYTKRSIYYQLLSMTKQISQGQLDDALNIVSVLLDKPLWQLNVLTTGKGLVHGPLSFTVKNIDYTCDAANGTTIPSDLNDLRQVKSSAHFILIVEKDAVFQMILANNMPNQFVRPFILITGKGFADVCTKRFLNILWRLLNIPIFLLADADLYGIEIFLNYKFGSKTTALLSPYVALPSLLWFGVLPSEIRRYNCKTIPLKPRELHLLKAMLNRPYFKNGHNAAIKKEIQTLIQGGHKSEIEGLYKSNRYFTHKYLIEKFYQKSFI